MFESYLASWRYRNAIFFTLLFLMSVYFSWQELVYLVRGNIATGTVTENYVMRSGRVLEYRFSETNGLGRKGSDTISVDEPIPSQLTIQYTPGENGRSRIQGHIRWVWLCIFGVAVAGLAFALYQLNKHMDEAMAPRKKHLGKAS